jgi:hypothetical protein
MVAVSAVIGAAIAVTVAIPSEVPAIALQAKPVYRLEVGGAIFVGLYLLATAIGLALQNRAFTEFGSGGVRARSLRDLPAGLDEHEVALESLTEIVQDLRKTRGDREGR